MIPPGPARAETPAVFFLSDYGLDDEFVGVVHAVLHRHAPSVPVIDLSHRIRPFDVAAGAALLARTVPHLGVGVVLAVVDPGVGSDRRPLAIGVRATDGPAWLVGPDNGLLVPAADVLGGAERVVLASGARIDRISAGATFDGRDVFAPAAAHLALGRDPDDLGPSVDPATLVTLGAPAPEPGPVPGVGPVLVASVGWIDRFGNVQLQVDAHASADILGTPGVRLQIALGPGPVPSGTPACRTDDAPTGFGVWIDVRRVAAFGELDPGQLGLLLDANGRPALVLDRSSAAVHLGIDRQGRAVALRMAG